MSNLGIRKIRGTRIAILASTFLFAFNYQPSWVLDNFWFKADFYDVIPFKISFVVFQFIYSSVTTFLVELGIKFIKKYA